VAAPRHRSRHPAGGGDGADDARHDPARDLRRFTATQVLAPLDGYMWAATARFLGLPPFGVTVEAE